MSVCVYTGEKPSEGGREEGKEVERKKKTRRNSVTSPAIDYELPDELRGRLCLKDGM